MAISRATTSRGGDECGVWGSGDPSFVGAYPALFEWLTEVQFEDGSPRKTSTMLVFVDDGCLKACLSDRADSRVAFVTSSTFVGLLAKLDQGLRTDSLEWRPASGGAKRGRR